MYAFFFCAALAELESADPQSRTKGREWCIASSQTAHHHEDTQRCHAASDTRRAPQLPMQYYHNLSR